jgi:exopolysaccharide production protein ExoZ
MKQKFLTIQYLRAIAALLVLASHALLYPIIGDDLGYARLGWLGVIIFFVISGFIMVVVSGEGRFSATEFMRRRIVRIVPLYWLATLLTAALALSLPSLFKTTVFDLAEVLQSLFFVPFYNAASEGIRPILKLGWTLNYEMFFYLCFALLAFLDARSRVIWLTIGFAALTVIGFAVQPEAAIPQFYTSYMPLAFVAGAWLGLMVLDGKFRAIPTWLLGAVAVAGLLGLWEGFALGGAVQDVMAFSGFLAFAVAIVLLALRFDELVPKLGLLERLGDASYSIYLVHVYFVAAIAQLMFHWLDPHDLVADYLVVAASLVIGAIGGAMVHRFIEKPLIRFFGRRSQREAQPA